jgi:hypothetical protein
MPGESQEGQARPGGSEYVCIPGGEFCTPSTIFSLHNGRANISVSDPLFINVFRHSAAVAAGSLIFLFFDAGVERLDSSDVGVEQADASAILDVVDIAVVDIVAVAVEDVVDIAESRLSGLSGMGLSMISSSFVTWNWNQQCTFDNMFEFLASKA